MTDDTPKFSKNWIENADVEVSFNGWAPPPQSLYNFLKVPVVTNFDPDANWVSFESLDKITAPSPSFKYMTYAEYYASVQQEADPYFMQGYSKQDAYYVQQMQMKQAEGLAPCTGPGCPMCNEFGIAETTPAEPLVSAIPGLAEVVTCPCGCNVKKAIWSMVIHLNDAARWSREQIADWLDTLDADLRFKLPETPEITEGE